MIFLVLNTFSIDELFKSPLEIGKWNKIKRLRVWLQITSTFYVQSNVYNQGEEGESIINNLVPTLKSTGSLLKFKKNMRYYSLIDL